VPDRGVVRHTRGQRLARPRHLSTGSPSTAPSTAAGGGIDVLFVCRANRCRSPLAAEVARASVAAAGLQERIRIHSAGTHALTGERAVPAMVEAARRVGVDLAPHRSRRLDASLIDLCELVVVLEPEHGVVVLDLEPDAASRCLLLGQAPELARLRPPASSGFAGWRQALIDRRGPVDLWSRSARALAIADPAGRDGVRFDDTVDTISACVGALMAGLVMAAGGGAR
jgi:protein-tyrosine-phosphatase